MSIWMNREETDPDTDVYTHINTNKHIIAGEEALTHTYFIGLK